MSEFDKIKDLQQRVSILESTIERLKNIAVSNADIVIQAQNQRHYCNNCSSDITDMNIECLYENCPHGLY